MGTSGPKENESDKFKVQKCLDILLLKTLQICKKYQCYKEDNILKLKEEIFYFLIHKDMNSSKQLMEKLLKEEDDKIIFDILLRIIESFFEKVNLLIDSTECPPTLKASLNTILYSAARLEINELKDFQKFIKEKYGPEFLSKADNNEELLVNEVLVEKLKKNIYSEQLIKTRLKSLCREKNIDYQFLGINNENNPEQNNSQINNSRSSLGQSVIKRSSKNPEQTDNKNINGNDDSKYSKDFDGKVINDPKKLFIIKTGEDMFLPYDEKIDEKCYKIHKIDNWANCFYNLKSKKLLEKYKEIVSKTEFSTFFEALNYEYGINNYPLDLKKAFEIYKNAADNTTDILSMYR